VGLEEYSVLNSGVWEESPMMLFDARDVLGVASDLGLDRTATSNLLLSHLSAYWGMRSLFRRRILRRLVPYYEDLFPFIRPDDLTLPRGPEFEAAVSARVRNLRELCEAHGAKMILVIPPSPSSESSVKEMAATAEEAGVKALVPIDPRALSAGFYQVDRIHLNSEGALRFTSALARDLCKTIGVLADHTS